MRREIAYKVLSEVTFKNRHAHIVLKELKLEAQDQAFVSALVYTVLQNMMFIDYQFADLVDGKLPKEVKLVIRMGLTQHFKMNDIPDYAVVNTSVELAKGLKLHRYSGVVNKVIKKVIARGERAIEGNALEIASIQHSMPLWIMKLLKAQYSEEFSIAYAEYCQSIKPTYIRMNGLNPSEFDPEIMEEVGNSIVAKQGLFRSPFLIEGHGVVQDINSQKVVPYMDLEDNLSVLDCCCGPGTKTLQIADMMHNTGIIHGVELHETRTQATQELMDRAKVTNTELITSDVLEFENDIDYDRILLDAPCSGLGVLSHKHDLRYHIFPQDLDALVALQSDMLDHVSKMLKVDGLLVYATCTLNKKENERQIQAFLERHDNYKLVKEETTNPMETSGDGFYFAQLVRIC